jgi:hypothetical protein
MRDEVAYSRPSIVGIRRTDLPALCLIFGSGEHRRVRGLLATPLVDQIVGHRLPT